MSALADRTVLITGGSRGLGLAIAQQCLHDGANVIVCGQNAERLEKAKPLLGVGGKQSVSFYLLDVANAEQVARTISSVLSQHGRVDALVNNAGVLGSLGALDAVSWEDWQRTIAVNLFGAVLMCQQLLPHFRSNAYGRIVNLSGGGATAPLPFSSAYGASKAALVRFTETLAAEVKDCGITVNAVAPGALNTAMLDAVLEAGADRAGADRYANALKQRDSGGASLAEAAALCAFLASEKSGFLTGKLVSAVWDPWRQLENHVEDLSGSDIYTLRRILPKDRGLGW